jgi:hypothetical protein
VIPLILSLACTPPTTTPDPLEPLPHETDLDASDPAPDTSAPPDRPTDTGELQNPPRPGALARSAALGPVRYVPAGTFTMGCVEGRDDVAGGCSWEERPPRQVTLTTPLWVAERETTQANWTSLGFQSLAYFIDPHKPIDVLTWWEALAFANAASATDGLPACYDLQGCDATPLGEGRRCAVAALTPPSGAPKDCLGWRLPTEAEWEYAARAGGDAPFPGDADPASVGWHFGNNRGHASRRACRLQPNAWGLCDMAGNVYEWVWDPFVDPDPAGAPQIDPVASPLEGDTYRVMRGGSWNMEAQFLRSASRNRNPQDYRGIAYMGFRLVRSAPTDPDPSP